MLTLLPLLRLRWAWTNSDGAVDSRTKLRCEVGVLVPLSLSFDSTMVDRPGPISFNMGITSPSSSNNWLFVLSRRGEFGADGPGLGKGLFSAKASRFSASSALSVLATVSKVASAAALSLAALLLCFALPAPLALPLPPPLLVPLPPLLLIPLPTAVATAFSKASFSSFSFMISARRAALATAAACFSSAEGSLDRTMLRGLNLKSGWVF
mmetsp:Transcript_56390/g.99037  ORF Transcript_56390/g.99037 Transcript_56390/m.99037 type:complete len:210 (-) Transcript_56390:1216-1845(-)